MNLAYDIIYSKRKTIAIVVERDRRVVVRAPVGTPEATVRQAVEAKKQWIYEKIHLPDKYPLERDRKEFVSGETLHYLGRSYRLEIVERNVPGVVFHSCFQISRRNRPHAAQLLRQWYLERARRRLTARAEYYAQALGVKFNRVLVSDMRVRWGSCTPKNNLNFNWRIIKAPPFVLDYLVVHELAHLLEPNHSSRFWNIVAVQVPRYEEARAWLKAHGNLLETDF
jgi:predicted metal-dependent hydrolase